MKKEAPFYVCEVCGLSLKPWEIQQAHARARRETAKLRESQMANSDEFKREKKNQKRKEYLNWYLKKGQ